MRTPDGITDEHERSGRRANLWPLALLVALLATALTGLLGGQPDPVRQVRNEAVSITVRAPGVLRSGMTFETLIEVIPNRDISDLVIGVPASLWHQMTINTMIPAAAEETHKQGYHRFSFGKVQAGEAFHFKIDGQVNPPLFAGTSGGIVIYDGERRLAAVPVTIKVLP